jgi:2-oxo-4-hydroxy-4-carboxy-5-ureidoimidazoline decarboxylase
VTLAQLNVLGEMEARVEFERCCGARLWAEHMLRARPFADRAALFSAAEHEFWALGEAGWREAFSHHPRIGDQGSALTKFARTAAWAAEEQSGAADASNTIKAGLAEANRVYEKKFGYVFIVCATGKTAEEMFGLLTARLEHAAERELAIAAGQQLEITKLRLGKLLGDRS